MMSSATSRLRLDFHHIKVDLKNSEVVQPLAWNYMVLSEFFFTIELFTYSYSEETYLHYVIDFLMLCTFWDFYLKNKKVLSTQSNVMENL